MARINTETMRYTDHELLNNHQISDLTVKMAYQAQKYAVIFYNIRQHPEVPDFKYLRSFRVDRYRYGATLSNKWAAWVEYGADPHHTHILGYHPFRKAAAYVVKLYGGTHWGDL